MNLIKITAVLIVIYFLFKCIMKLYINSLSNLDKLRFGMNNFTVLEMIMLSMYGLLRVSLVVALSVTFLNFVFTHF